MATKTNIRWQKRVDRPYNAIHDALTMHASEVFSSATTRAETQANSVVSDLHTKIAGLEFRKDVDIKIRTYTDIETTTERKMVIDLEWKAAESKFLFPTMTAQLHVFPIKENSTQFDFRGEYEPPLGFLGKAIDVVVGHRIANACVEHFVEEVAQYFERSLSNVTE
ncbi:MAG: hypothetical protein ACI87E_005335 [Mariniblastus sp.]